MTGPRIDPRISLGNIISLAGVLELTDEQVDDLFRAAMQIKA